MVTFDTLVYGPTQPPANVVRADMRWKVWWWRWGVGGVSGCCCGHSPFACLLAREGSCRHRDTVGSSCHHVTSLSAGEGTPTNIFTTAHMLLLLL